MIVSLIKNKIRKEYRVHRLVANAFLENKENKPYINHIDGNPLNNDVSNLEWCTQKENIEHYYKHLKKFKYNENEIVDMYLNGITPLKICEELQISKIILYRILKKHKVKINGVSFYKNKHNIDLDELLKDLKENKSIKELAIKYDCSPNLISVRKYQFKKGGKLL